MLGYKASQPAGFFAASDRIEQLRRMQDPVLRRQEAVDWELFRATLEALVANAHPKPFVWTASASDIPAKVKRRWRKLHNIQSA